MDKQINYLHKLVQGLKTLEERQFKYSSFVAHYEVDDSGNICGTTCCAFGWLPKFVPEAGVTWQNVIHGECEMSIYGYYSVSVIDIVRKTFSAIDVDIVDFMFLGNHFDPYNIEQYYGADSVISEFFNSCDTNDITNFGSGMSANLTQVINRIETVIDFFTKKFNIILNPVE